MAAGLWLAHRNSATRLQPERMKTSGSAALRWAWVFQATAPNYAGAFRKNWLTGMDGGTNSSSFFLVSRIMQVNVTRIATCHLEEPLQSALRNSIGARAGDDHRLHLQPRSSKLVCDSLSYSGPKRCSIWWYQRERALIAHRLSTTASHTQGRSLCYCSLLADCWPQQRFLYVDSRPSQLNLFSLNCPSQTAFNISQVTDFVGVQSVMAK